MSQFLVCPKHPGQDVFVEHAKAWRTVTEKLEPLRERGILRRTKREFLCVACRRKAKIKEEKC